MGNKQSGVGKGGSGVVSRPRGPTLESNVLPKPRVTPSPAASTDKDAVAPPDLGGGDDRSDATTESSEQHVLEEGGDGEDVLSPEELAQHLRDLEHRERREAEREARDAARQGDDDDDDDEGGGGIADLGDDCAAVEGDDGVSVAVIPDKAAVLCGVKNTVRVLVQIKTPPPPADRVRPQMNVACVMDRSGSMQIEKKLTFAKHGVRKLIKHLGETDRLHFVVYDTNVETIFADGDLSEAGKAGLVKQVKAVKYGTATNLQGGLEAGAALLRTPDPCHSTEDGKDSTDGAGSDKRPEIKRIFLFSDGVVNEGVTDPEEICATVRRYVAEGININSFGIGQDFDEALMTRIADEGKGEYAYLKNAAVIPGLVSKQVHRVLDLVGTNAKLVLRGLNGACVTKVFGHEDVPDALVDGLDIGDLHLSNTRQILVELEIAPGGGGAFGDGTPQTPILSYSLEYEAASSSEKQRNALVTGLATATTEDEVLAAMDGILGALHRGDVHGFSRPAVLEAARTAKATLIARDGASAWSTRVAKRFGIMVKAVNSGVIADDADGEKTKKRLEGAPPAPKLTHQGSSSGRAACVVQGTLTIASTEDRATAKLVPKTSAPVEVAYALQVSAGLDLEVVARLDAGDMAAALLAKGQAVKVLEEAFAKLGGSTPPAPREEGKHAETGAGGGGGAVEGLDMNQMLLLSALQRAKAALANMQRDRDVRSARLENFEGCRLQRAMSVCQLQLRADSEEGDYSDEEPGDWADDFGGFGGARRPSLRLGDSAETVESAGSVGSVGSLKFVSAPGLLRQLS